MFVSVSRNGQLLASIPFVSTDQQKAANLLASFLSQGGCQFTVKRREVGSHCVTEELSTDELRYQIKALQAQANRPKYTKVYVGPSNNALRSSWNKRIGAHG